MSCASLPLGVDSSMHAPGGFAILYILCEKTGAKL
jgi:hypothetical protein